MKNIGILFCAIALAGALPLLTRAQTAPAPSAPSVTTFTITGPAVTGGTATVVMLPPGAAAAPAPVTVAAPAVTAVPAAPPVVTTTAATTPAPRTFPALLPRPTPLPAAPAMTSTSAPAFPLLPRLPGVLSGGTSSVATPGGVSPALAAAASGTTTTNADTGVQLNFRDAPIDQLLNMYGDLTGRTVIKGPMINAIITVRSQSSLTVPEAIQALESVLQLNGIALVPMGAKFVKVTKSELGRMESLALKHGGKDGSPAETDQLASFIFTLKYIETEDVVPALQNVLHTYGKIQVLERANSVMLTDTSANLLRAQEILEFMDVPPEARVETKIYELENGDAAMVAAQLQSIVDDAQGKNPQQRQRQPGVPAPVPVALPGMVRAPSVGGANGEALEEGLIQGKVKILSDDRTNMIIIIARPSNFPFFERLIKELDRKVEPEVIVRVIQLQWSDADQIAGLLNDMLGSSGGSYGTRGATPGGAAVGGVGAAATGARTTGTSATARRTGTSGSRTSSTSANRSRTASSTARPGGVGAAGTVNPFGNNAPNITTTTRVLADLRSNALLMMGTKEDIADLEKVIEKLDVMLSQVLIEAVILEVDLNKTTEAGISWLQRSLQAYNQTSAGPGGGSQIRQPVAAFGGGFNDNKGNSSIPAVLPNGGSIANGFSMAPGMNYYTTISGLNLDTIIHLVNNTSEARILSTPVIMATDNEAAEIKNTTQYPVITSSTILTTGGGTSSSYEYKDIGIDLIVKPHINPNRMVVMDITQTADSISSTVPIDGNQVPIINKREIQGLITVEDRTTIVLGGLIETTTAKARSAIPILGNIPLIGWLFRSDIDTGKRTELLVLITPYVLKTPEEARAETARLHKNSEMKEVHVRGWSDSPLAKPDNTVELVNRKRTLFGKNPAPVAPTNAVPSTAVPAAK